MTVAVLRSLSGEDRITHSRTKHEEIGTSTASISRLLLCAKVREPPVDDLADDLDCHPGSPRSPLVDSACEWRSAARWIAEAAAAVRASCAPTARLARRDAESAIRGAGGARAGTAEEVHQRFLDSSELAVEVHVGRARLAVCEKAAMTLKGIAGEIGEGVRAAMEARGAGREGEVEQLHDWLAAREATGLPRCHAGS